MRPEVSSLSKFGAVQANGIDLPSLMVRRADTTVEVASGQTFAIAGLFQRQMSLDYGQTPEIADLPVLGPLFRSARYRRDETELVILITPILVNPVRDRGLATPLDRPAPPPPAPIPVPVCIWCGFYLGLNAGGTWSDNNSGRQLWGSLGCWGGR